MAGPGASSKKLASRPARTSSWTSGRLAGRVTTGPTTGGGRCACGRGGAATGGRGGDDLVAGRAMTAGEGLGAPRGAARVGVGAGAPVSYTHLTLPTKA